MNDYSYCVLSERGLILFEGEDTRAFLHGQLTCDVQALSVGESTYGAYCTPKGRVLATFLLCRAADGFFMQLPHALCEPVRKRLSMYVLRSKVRAHEATADYRQYALAGPAAAAAAERLASQSAAIATLPGARKLAIVARARESAALEILAAATRMNDAWWDALDLEAGLANVLPATQEQFVPQMLNLDAIGGVSFSKGCYPGQEIVARMHYLGRLKERMVRARIVSSQSPSPGDKVYGADLGTQSAGMIVNVAPRESGAYDVLAVVHLSSVAAGPLRLGAVDGTALELQDLPYAVPAG